MEAQPRDIRNYQTADGKDPFAKWLDSLRDMLAIDKIEKRLKRVQLGNLGDYRSVGEGVFEFRINYGSEYHIYFGQLGTEIILLLCAEDKSTQQQNIQKAKEYWEDYERRESTDK